MSSLETVEFDKDGVSFEEALTRTKFGKFNYIFILVCGNLFMCWFYEVLGVGYYLPVAECDLKITSKIDYGIINGMAFAGILFSYHLFGFLADTKGRKKVLLPTLFVSLIFTVLSSVTKSFWLFAVFRFINGFFVSTSSSITFSYLAEFHDTKNRSRAIMMASSIYGLIGILLPLCAGLIVNQEWSFHIPIVDVLFKPWRLFVLFCGLPSLVSVLLLLWLPESPKFIYAQGDEEEAIRILRRVYKMNTGLDDYDVIKIDDVEFGTAKSSKDYLGMMWEQTKTLFSKTYLRITLIVCYLQFGAGSFGIGMLVFFPKILHGTGTYMDLKPGDHSLTICGIQDFMAAQIHQSNGTSVGGAQDCIEKLDWNSFTYPMITETLYMTGFFVVGMLVNLVGLWPLSYAIFGICAVASVALIFITIPVLSNIVYIIMLLYFLNSNMIGSATIDYYPTNLRSTALGVSLLFGRLGSILGTNIIGFLFDFYCDSTFMISAITYASCIIVSMFLPK